MFARSQRSRSFFAHSCPTPSSWRSRTCPSSAPCAPTPRPHSLSLIHALSYDFIPFVEKHIHLSAVDVVYNSVRVVFLLVLAFALFSVLRMQRQHLQSKCILLAIFVIRLVPSILMSLKFGTVADPAGPSINQVVGDGMYLAILTSDLIIAKIANRQVHVLLPVIALASLISHHVSVVAACIYHITIVYDLCVYLQVRCVLRLCFVACSRPSRDFSTFCSVPCFHPPAAFIATACSTCCTLATWLSSARRLRSPMEITCWLV